MATSYLLNSETLNDQALDVANRIKRNASAMKGLINDLLEYAGGQLGRKMPIKKEAANMESTCREALDEVQANYPEVIFNFESSGDTDGYFDPARIQQVLSNLLNNAAKYGKQDTPVTLSAHGETETIIVQVKNFAPPIPPDSLQVIFNPLVQLSYETNRDSHITTSLGLGLFIAKEIVEGHNGKIEVKSSEMEGTVFTVRLPKN
jgi:signal transduction histidine kinase